MRSKILTGLFLTIVPLAACGSHTISRSAASSPTVSPTVASTPVLTPNPAHFVSPDPGTAKNSGNQNQQDPFAALIPLHELGLTPGVAVDYRLTGTATANYSCVRTDGTLNAAPGSNQDVTSPLTVSQRFIPDASGEVQGVIVVPPPRPSNTSCPAGTALQAWGSHYTGLVVTDITNGVNWSAGDIGAQA